MDYNKSITDRQLQILIGLGWDAHEIAHFASRSVQTVYNRLSKAGLSIKKPATGRARAKTDGQQIDTRKPVVGPSARALADANLFGSAHGSNF